MIKQKIRDKALKLWNEGKYNLAGKVIFESLPRKKRVIWASSILRVVCEKCYYSKELEELLTVSLNEELWKNADQCFSAIRKRSIAIQDDDGMESRSLDVGELVAKIVFNESGGHPKYDDNAGWLLGNRILKVTELISSVEGHIEKELWARYWGDLEP